MVVVVFFIRLSNARMMVANCFTRLSKTKSIFHQLMDSAAYVSVMMRACSFWGVLLLLLLLVVG